MWWTQISTLHKKTTFSFMVVCCLIISASDHLWGSSATPAVREADQSQDESLADNRTIVVGLPKGREDAFMKSMARSEKKRRYLHTARTLHETGEHSKAIGVLEEALNFVNRDNLDSVLFRDLLADIYETTGQKEEFLAQVDWLIKHTQNDKTREDLVERRAQFLKTFGE